MAAHRADIHLANQTRQRYHLHDSLYLNRFSRTFFDWISHMYLIKCIQVAFSQVEVQSRFSQVILLSHLVHEQLLK